MAMAKDERKPKFRATQLNELFINTVLLSVERLTTMQV